MRKNPTFQSFVDFLRCFNVLPCKEVRLIPYDRYVLLIVAARSWFGDNVGDWLMDSFTPTGQPIEPGYEDSLTSFIFDFETMEELEEDWNLREEFSHLSKVM